MAPFRDALPDQRFVPDRVIAGAHFVVWGLLSIAILVLAGAF